jgi:hypothetical protein
MGGVVEQAKKSFEVEIKVENVEGCGFLIEPIPEPADVKPQ